ncbi:hypothetical protein Taro_023589 [Colocasia esculenta]|uniref:C2 domain-containing protein n=1 Tax=Colocasia esculenta TaxID=4460 RepID=A0A843V4K4_COLES|nr:hypothetical protein [Colocasia esculenta]
MNELPPSRIGKHMRVSTTTTVNLNLSSANLETMIESIISWRKQMDLQQKSSKKNEEPDVHFNCIDGSKFSALEEDDLQRVIVENKLGCGIYIRKLEQNSERVELLEHGKQASVAIPPPRFSDRLNASDETRENRYYVAIKIFESKGLPIEDDGNAHDFFCALRLVVDTNLAEQSKLFPQSARTRCVRPLVSRGTDVIQGIVKWNEIFIFEIPEKGLANLEVEVTNLASRAGKGTFSGKFICTNSG